MGFEPIYDNKSKVLILGSFPSVKSREISFYYGNKQNRFWSMLCGFFQEKIPESVENKKDLLLRNGIALWDMVSSCEIEGSADSSIQNAHIVDLHVIFKQACIEKILLNGALAYDLFCQKYVDIQIPYKKMPSTSPANPRFDMEIWRKELNDIFRIF